MTIVIPADVLPLLYSGLQLDLWQRVLPELAELLERPGRAEHPEWFTEAFAHLDRTRALLKEIDWPRTRPPAATEVAKEHRAALLAGLYAERDTQRYVAQDEEGAARDLELRERSTRAVEMIERFLAVLVQDEVQDPIESGTAGRFTDPRGIERAIVLQVLRDVPRTSLIARELGVCTVGRWRERNSIWSATTRSKFSPTKPLAAALTEMAEVERECGDPTSANRSANAGRPSLCVRLKPLAMTTHGVTSPGATSGR